MNKLKVSLSDSRAEKSFSRGLFFAQVIIPIFLFAVNITAQTISGTVSDARNAPVEAAQISLSAKNKIIAETKTGAQGKFSIDKSGANDLILRVSAEGFANFEKPLSELKTPLEIVLQAADLREEVTVSIAGAETRLSETPASVVALDRETLNQTAAQTVDDALRQVAGFTLFRRSSSRTTNPTAQGANLRGVSGSGAARTSVQLDGVSLNDAFGGWTYWTRAPKIAVETVEVLRGGASSIYGDAALSGAVNLTTRRADGDKPIVSFETSAGTQNTFDNSFFGAYGKNGWSASLAAQSFQTAGYIPVAENERGAADSNANSRFNSGILTLERRFNANSRIFVRGNLFSERRDNGTRLTNNRTYFRQAVFGADFANDKFGAFQFRSSIEAQVYDQTFSAVSADRDTENLTRVQRVPSQAKTATLFWSRAFGNHIVSASFDAREVRGFSDETIINNNRAASLVGAGGREFSNGVFVQDFWRVNRKLNVNFGARFDFWKNYDALSTTRNLNNQQTTVLKFTDRNQQSFSPRVGAIYQINDNFSVLASFSKSFRAPTLNELYRAFRVGNVLTTANENLLAERAATFEAGANFSGFSRRLNLRANVFQTEVSNPVVNVTLSATPTLITRQRQNVGETGTRGVELDAEWTPRRDVRVSAGYLFVDSRVAAFPANPNLIEKRLPQIPRQQLTAQIFYRPPSRFSLGLQMRASDAQFEDDQNLLRLRPFFTADLLGAYRIGERFEIFAAAENVFDNRYDIGLTPTRTVAAPRFVRVGLRY